MRIQKETLIFIYLFIFFKLVYFNITFFFFIFFIFFFIFYFLMPFLSAYILFMYVCMYVWLCWVLASVRGPSPAVASGGHSSSRCRGHSSSRCAGLSPSRPLAAEHRLQTCRLSNCGSRAEPLRGMWDPPRPGLEPVSPALAGRLPTTAPPGKPETLIFMINSFMEERRKDSLFNK